MKTKLILLFGILFLITMFVAGQMNRARQVSLDIPESECDFPIYTAHGDYALCNHK